MKEKERGTEKRGERLDRVGTDRGKKLEREGRDKRMGRYNGKYWMTWGESRSEKRK